MTIRKHILSLLAAGVILLLSISAITVGPKLIKAFTPPKLPKVTEQNEARWLQQQWSASDRFWFHHATQGTSTFEIPYEWFIALEQPRILYMGARPMFRNADYLGRFGFISSPDSLETDEATLKIYGYAPGGYGDSANQSFAYDETKFAGNEHSLPVGFARLKRQINGTQIRDPQTGEALKYDQIGFTCAACHTGHLEYKGISLRIDGAPAMTDLGKFRAALQVALIYTKYIPGRFDSFANDVLGEKREHEDARKWKENKKKLKAELNDFLDRGRKRQTITGPISKHDTNEGFARIDALNRIGNTVFFEDLMEWDKKQKEWVSAVQNVEANYVPLTAPVNYPQIWDTPWFEWVQYDASILQPMVRNAGEALGVAAKINLINPGPRLYRSLLQVDEIYDLESMLAGDSPWPTRKFDGLQPPKWPEDIFGDIVLEGRRGKDRGRELYAENCQGCHLPPVNDPDWLIEDPTAEEFWDPAFWTSPKYVSENEEQRYLRFTKYDPETKPKFANLVGVDYVGTDPEQAKIMVKRQVRVPLYLDIDPTTLCRDEKPVGANADVEVDMLFASALAVVVQKATGKWYDIRKTTKPDQARMNGYRQNCIKAEMFYKARPLDGVWATAPFLHNGSVPNIELLLSPAGDRPEAFCLGDRTYEPEKIGYAFKKPRNRTIDLFKKADKKKKKCANGYSVFDASERGNSNLGHEFSNDKSGKGVIGNALDEDDRAALIEYIKSL